MVERIERLEHAMESAPKTLKWRLRAKVGPRVQWYEPVQEIDR